MTEEKITIAVQLDDEKLPEKILWEATDNPEQGVLDAKAMLLSFFDSESKDTLKIDLWTKKMQVVEMDRFMFQTLKGLSNTYASATGNGPLSQAMKQFTQYFGEETEIIKKEE